MSNMSYCRFQNTASDLDDCLNALGEVANSEDSLSEDELRAAVRLVKTCSEILLLVAEQGALEGADEMIEVLADYNGKFEDQVSKTLAEMNDIAKDDLGDEED